MVILQNLGLIIVVWMFVSWFITKGLLKNDKDEMENGDSGTRIKLQLKFILCYVLVFILPLILLISSVQN